MGEEAQHEVPKHTTLCRAQSFIALMLCLMSVLSQGLQLHVSCMQVVDVTWMPLFAGAPGGEGRRGECLWLCGCFQTRYACLCILPTHFARRSGIWSPSTFSVQPEVFRRRLCNHVNIKCLLSSVLMHPTRHSTLLRSNRVQVGTPIVDMPLLRLRVAVLANLLLCLLCLPPCLPCPWSGRWDVHARGAQNARHNGTGEPSARLRRGKNGCTP